VAVLRRIRAIKSLLSLLVLSSPPFFISPHCILPRIPNQRIEWCLATGGWGGVFPRSQALASTLTRLTSRGDAHVCTAIRLTAMTPRQLGPRRWSLDQPKSDQPSNHSNFLGVIPTFLESQSISKFYIGKPKPRGAHRMGSRIRPTAFDWVRRGSGSDRATRSGKENMEKRRLDGSSGKKILCIQYALNFRAYKLPLTATCSPMGIDVCHLLLAHASAHSAPVLRPTWLPRGQSLKTPAVGCRQRPRGSHQMYDVVWTTTRCIILYAWDFFFCLVGRSRRGKVRNYFIARVLMG
jgi:hypothetical protein